MQLFNKRIISLSSDISAHMPYYQGLGFAPDLDQALVPRSRVTGGNAAYNRLVQLRVKSESERRLSQPHMLYSLQWLSLTTVTKPHAFHTFCVSHIPTQLLMHLSSMSR